MMTVRPLALALFGSACVAAAAYVYPHMLAVRLQREIIVNNEKVTEALATVSSGTVATASPNTGLFGQYM